MGDLQTVPGTTAIAFSEYDPRNAKARSGELATVEGGVIRAIRGEKGDELALPENQTHYGYMSQGSMTVVCAESTIVVPKGFYFSFPGEARIRLGGYCQGIIVSRPGYQGFLTMGKLEYEGRLRYINGCTDSLLVAPIKLGDPCLNLLYFPENTDQTMHTHPSDRIGMVLSGGGQCISEDERGTIVTPLTAGMLFCIHTGGHHKFRTFHGHMRVLAYHPDSDFGPTDEDHPMINRTMVGGISAAKLPEIHTA